MRHLTQCSNNRPLAKTFCIYSLFQEQTDDVLLPSTILCSKVTFSRSSASFFFFVTVRSRQNKTRKHPVLTSYRIQRHNLNPIKESGYRSLISLDSRRINRLPTNRLNVNRPLAENTRVCNRQMPANRSRRSSVVIDPSLIPRIIRRRPRAHASERWRRRVATRFVIF